MVRLYGITGCGPCEVAKLYLERKGLVFEFIDLSRDGEARARLSGRLGSPQSGVVLEDGDNLEVIIGVSPAKLERWYEGYLRRASFAPRAAPEPPRRG